MKSRTFFICGSDYARFDAIDNPDFYILNKKYFSNPIVIGDPVEGIALEEMDRLLAANIEPTDQIINIVLNMHGYSDKVHKHLLEILPPLFDEEEFGISIPTANVLRSIADATGGKPINIFTPTCYGGNMHAFADLLPNGSTLITLADVDKPGAVYDLYNKMTQKMMQSAQAHGDTFKYLLPMSALSAKFENNTPMISRKTMDGLVQRLDLPSIANQLLQHPLHPTPFLVSLFKAHVLKESVVFELATSVGNADVTTLKQPPLLEQAYTAWSNGIFEAFKTEIEAKYYQLGALAPLNINFTPYQHLWDMRDEMSAWDQNKRDAFTKFTEMGKLLVQGMPCDHRGYFELHDTFSKYESGINDLRDLEEDAYQRTIISFDQTHADEYSDKCNMLEPIYDAIPNYNLLLGVAAAEVVEELFCIQP